MGDQKLFLGVDCGGSKTEALLCDDKGDLIGSGQADNSNLHNLPLPDILENIHLAITAAQNGNSSPIETACLGISGLDTVPDKAKITLSLKESSQYNWINQTKNIFLCSDGLIGLKSGTNENYGICLISSTGSNCYGIDSVGHEHKSGDWGYLLGDQGSGYSIGIKMIRQVLREFDGRAESSPLTGKILAYLNLSSPIDLVDWAYHDRAPIKQIASLTKLLEDYDIANHKVTQSIINSTITELLSAYSAVIHHLEFLSLASFSVVLVGGLFNLTNKIELPLTEGIKHISPQAKIILSSQSPAYGAVKIAQDEKTQVHLQNNIIPVIR